MGWRDEMITALDEWVRAEGGGARRADRWRRIGAARATAEPGVFVVDVRGLDVGPEQLDGLRLAGPEETSAQAGFRVMEAVVEEQLLRVRVAEFAAPPDPYLWSFRRLPGFLVKALRDGVAGIGDAGLANLLALREIGGTPARGPAPAGLLPAQAQAYRACLGTGVWLVWGPPGTGKTRLLQEAIGDLITQGKRVLLVSATNIAVDNALLGVLKRHRPAAGRIVRVGPPQLRQVADDPEVCLPLIVRARLAKVEKKRRDLAVQLKEVLRDEERSSQLRGLLDGFDPAAYAGARSRLRRPEFACAPLAATVAECEQAFDAGAVARIGAQRRIDAAGRRVAETEEARRLWRRIEEKERGAGEVASAATQAEARALRSEAGCGRLEDEAALLVGPSGRPRLWDRRAFGELERRIAEARAEAAGLRSRAVAARATADRVRRDADASTRDLIARAGFELDEIRARDVEADDARRSLDELRSAQRATAERLAAARRELAASEAAAKLVAECDRRRWPKLHDEAEEVRRRVERDAPRLDPLKKRYEAVQNEYEALERDAQGEIIKGARLVATTLARFRITKAVAEGPYDVVLIDEAGAATLPEVLLATSKASACAVLLGDFLQLEAVQNKVIEDSGRQDIRRWLHPDVFRHCGITTPEEAMGHPGCLVMDTQHRFGPQIMELANRIAYKGVLKAGGTARPRATDDPEIVIIDTDGLHELARVQRTGRSSGWWPAGTLLSRALLDLHNDNGEIAGVVTPYSDQAAATLEALRDIEQPDGRLAEVGTAHRFQGREFPIVIFDTVEAQYGDRMWMAEASLASGATGWQRKGGRLFNVAVTRVQTRLYVVGSGERILGAPSMTAFGQLARLHHDGKVRLVRATALIAPPTAVTEALGPFGARLAETLARHVEITDVHDELSFYETFAARLAEARSSIWLWAPWVATRVRSLLPALRDAVGRGVRVTVFVRDPGDNLQGKENYIAYLAELQAIVPAIVRVNVMHQKIAVIDEQTVLLGSLNMLSQNWTREIVLTVRGGHFARKILEHEHAEDFSRPPRCAGCQRDEVDLRRRRDGRWFWHCHNRECPARRGNQAWTSDVVFSRHQV
ncbi:AAA domain-containing protein [Herbidospora mongoliensis]|uniref:AAA domain-containing protein n=1 Tax=Herbidospora mongoliensis TaxID=688067 RepID=UPI000834B861|nr:AAA domain-containing protein [Herbidospora mongoliensis]